MEGWPRIPNQGGSSSSRPKATIPAPGTVVMASVEEDLGDGMYSLRWGGNRIAVSSRSPLKPGQSLILKSETNAEGKPTLVVQGPALPEPGSITGKIIYGPGKNRAHAQGNQAADVQAKNTAQAETHDARAGQTPGGQVAAGTAKAVATPPSTPTQPVQNLVGLVLEPLPELEAGVRVLEVAVKEEKARLEEKEKSGDEAAKQPDEAQDEDAPEQDKNIVLDRRDRPAAGGRGGPGPLPLTAEAPERPAQPAETARPLPTPPPAADQFDRSALARPAPLPPQNQPPPAEAVRPAPPPAQPPVQPNAAGPSVPDVPEVPATVVREQQRPAATVESVPPQTQPQPQPPVQAETAKPVVPDVPASVVREQQPPPEAARPAPPQTPPQPVQPNTTGPTVPESPAASQPSQQPPAEAIRPAPPQAIPQPVQPETIGPNIPEAPAAATQDRQPPAEAARPAPQPQTQTPQPAQPQGAPGATEPPVPDVPATPLPDQPQQSARPEVPPQPAQPTPQPSRPAETGQVAVPLPETPAPVPAVPHQPPAAAQPQQPVSEGAAVRPLPQPADQARPLPPSSEQPLPPPSTPTPTPAPAPSQPQQPLVEGATAQPLPQPMDQTRPLPPSSEQPLPQPSTPPPAPPQQPASGGTAAQPLPQPTDQARPLPPSIGQPPPPQLRPSEAGPTVPEPAPQPTAPATPPPPTNRDAPAQPVPAQPQPLPGNVGTPSGGVVPPADTGPTVTESPPPQTTAPSQPQPAPSGPPPAQPAPPPEAAAEAPPPRQDASPPSRHTGIYGPPRRDTDAIRQRQATLPAAANSTAETEGDASRTRVQPEIFLKEALTQMIKAAELPLGGDAQTPALAVANKPPQAVVDKAADLFLRAAGFEPDEQTMAAARALVRHSVPVDRDNVQAMLDASVDAPEAEQEAVLNAAARLLSKDIPVSPPLVAGLADVLDRRAGTHAIMQQAVEALSVETEVPEARALMDDARQLLDMLHVDLGREDAGAALERYLSTFGKETLGKALALVETSAQAVLESSPELQRLDKAIAAVLTELTGDMAQAQLEELGPDGLPAKPNLSLEQLPPVAVQPLPAPTARPMPAINAYLNAPRAFNVAEALKNLPPMPKLVSINSPVPQEPPAPQPAAPGQTDQQPQQPPQPAAKLPPQQQQPLPPSPGPMPTPGESTIMDRLDSLFRMPGLNRPEFELLRPSGFMERFLWTADDAPDSERVKADARALMRQLTSENPEVAEKAMKDLKTKTPEVLKETAARLNEREAEALRSNNVLNRLSDAATSLRDLGRQLLAVKAENLAGQEREPGVMLAEVPFKLNNDAGDGRMQMFYRKSKKKEEGWSSRVILDLNTTRMGPVLGDMRFFGQDMVLNMFVERQDTADYLDASGSELVSALADKGFRVKARFMVLPPRRAPEIRAERPTITGEETQGTSGDHKLDIRT